MKIFSQIPFARNMMLAAVMLMSVPLIHGEGVAENPVSPFLWEVSGNGLTVPSYLFGTIHVGDERVTNLHPAVEKAFDEAEVVLTEVPLDMASQLAAAPKMMRTDGKSLDEAIGNELAELVNKELELINPALDSKSFQGLSTWVVATMIPLLPDQLAGKTALDKILWDRAEKEGKRMGAIETMESQLSVFTKMTEEEQVIFLSESLKAIKGDREAGEDTVEVMKLAYAAGDLEKLHEVLEQGFSEMEAGQSPGLARAFKKRLFTDRDVSMAKTIGEKLKAEPSVVHFFAAGVGHFSSDTSIRSHLEKTGYTVTRVLE